MRGNTINDAGLRLAHHRAHVDRLLEAAGWKDGGSYVERTWTVPDPVCKAADRLVVWATAPDGEKLYVMTPCIEECDDDDCSCHSWTVRERQGVGGIPTDQMGIGSTIQSAYDAFLAARVMLS